MLPQPFDFRGGTVTGEKHLFPNIERLVPRPGDRRIFVNQRPLRTVTALNIQFTNTYEIDLNPVTDVMVNETLGFCEIVASQPTIIGYPPVGVWFGPWQPTAYISYTYGYRQAITDDTCEAYTPTVYYATYGQWDSTVTPVVKIDDVTQTTGYTVNTTDGSITFTTAPTPSQVVTVDYTATLPDAVAQATGLIATDMIGQSRIAARGLIGLQSLKVAEVAMSLMTPRSSGTTRNGVTIPDAAAGLLAGFALGSAA